MCWGWRGPGLAEGKAAWDCPCLSLPSAPLCVFFADWKLLALALVLVVVMVWYSISREDRYIEFFYFPVSEKKEPCFQGEAERQASKIFGK